MNSRSDANWERGVIGPRGLHVDPVLQSVSKLLSLDWLSQGAEGGLELGDGGGEVLEPAVCADLLLQDPPPFP